MTCIMTDKYIMGEDKMEILFTHITDELQAGWIEVGKYSNGNMALQLMTLAEPYAKLSTNVEGVVLEKGEFLAKNFSENTGLLEQFLEMGLFEDTGRKVSSGFVTIPVYKFNG